MDTPYQWTKQVASHWGGTRNGTIVHWPHGFQAQGEMRHQFHHVIDVAPTILEAAGLPEPVEVNGVTQTPIEGVEHAVLVRRGRRARPSQTQYFEMLGNRGIYHEGWTAMTTQSHAVGHGSSTDAFAGRRRELYDTNDWTQANDLAQRDAREKLRDLQRLWLIEATKYNVLPLDDALAERCEPARWQAGRS